MPYHVVAYTANNFNQTALDTVAVTDTLLAVQNNHYLPHMDLNLYGGLFYGANLTQVKLVTPRSRMVVPPVLYPVVGALLPPDRPHFFDRRFNPFKLSAVEEVSLQINIGGTANAQNILGMFWGTSIDPVPQGDIYALHGTSTTAAVALTWTQIAVVWDQNLPAGNYAVIGSQHQSTNALLHRFFFKDQLLRPGFGSIASLQNISEPSYYYGGWGKLGTFNTFTFPTVEVFVNGTDNAHDVVMNLVRVS